MKVELLWWEGCPSTPEAMEDLKQVLREEGLDPEAVDLVEVESDEQAERERFPGSPTIRIDGGDGGGGGGNPAGRPGGRPSPAPPPPRRGGGAGFPPADSDPVGLTCRVYRLRDGRPSPTPDPADLRAAVRRAA